MYWDDKYGTQSVSNEVSFIFGLFDYLVKEGVVMFYMSWKFWLTGGCSDEGHVE